MIDEDDWALDYAFQSNDDEKIFFNRLFPKGDAAPPGVNYYFNDKKLFKSFEDSIKARGYTRFKYKRHPDDLPSKKLCT